MAAWHMDLWRFAEVIGSDTGHEYTQEKFRQLTALNKALAQFDADTLAKIIETAKSPVGDSDRSESAKL